MALQVGLPLNGNLHNQGLSSVTVTNNGATVDNSGKIGKCYSFTTSQNLLVNNVPFSKLTNCSISFWIYIGTAEDGLPFTGQTTSYYVMATSAGTGNFYHQNAGSGMKIYCDGVERSNPGSYGVGHHYCITGIDLSTGTAFKVNNYSSGGNFTGKMNDIRIYDHKLSQKEVKEISKGLILHYPLNDGEVETTFNIASAVMPSINIGGGHALTSTKLTDTSYHLKHDIFASQTSYGSTFVYTLPSYYANKTISFSAKIKNIQYSNVNDSTSGLFFGQGNDGQYPTHGTATFTYNQLYEFQQLTGTGALTNSNRYLVLELGSNDLNEDGKIEFDLYDIQIEEKDHVTEFTPNYRGLLYDQTIYTEPDGTKGIRIAHHNNPVNGLFSSSSYGNAGVYIDENRGFDVYRACNGLSCYEFMVKQKTTSSASETKYRGIQNKNPLTASYSDVAPNAVKRITTSGYTDGGYGGLYILNSSSYMVIANTNNGNGYGAFGCYTLGNGGIPGYPNTGPITSGYMDLYVKIDDLDFPKIYDCSGYKNDGSIIGDLQISYDTSRYNKSTIFSKSNTNYISIPYDKLQGSYNNKAGTISFGINTQQQGDRHMILGIKGSYNTNIELSTGNSLRVYGAGTPDGYPGINCELNKGTHVVVVITTSYIKCYKNGVLINTNNTTPNGAGCTGDFLIGSDQRIGTYFLGAKLSDFRIYSTELSADDIKELYDTSTIVDNSSNLLEYQLSESCNNLLNDEDAGIKSKTGNGGLSYYQQSNCTCSLTDTGYRIYRPANKTVSNDGNTMGGGFVINNANNRYNFQDGHTYMLQFEVKGKTSNSVTSVYGTNLVGGGGGGLNPSPSNVINANPVTSNYNSSEGKTFTYKGTINDGVYKTCTSAYHTFVQGQKYLSYAGFKYGFDYMDTGSLGSDIYIRNIRMYDITNNQNIQILKSGIIDSINFVEEDINAEVSPGGFVVNQLIEI